jgi:hypothetical protein
LLSRPSPSSPKAAQVQMLSIDERSVSSTRAPARSSTPVEVS